MRRLLKWGCLRTLGLVALVAVFGVIGAIVAPMTPSSRCRRRINYPS
jgi:hypothetical protein